MSRHVGVCRLEWHNLLLALVIDVKVVADTLDAAAHAVCAKTSLLGEKFFRSHVMRIFIDESRIISLATLVC